MPSVFAFPRRGAARLAAIAALFLVAACGNEATAPRGGNGEIPEDSLPVDTLPATKPVAIVQVGVDGSVEVPAGEQRQMRVVLRAADGSILAGRQVAWSVSDQAVATIDAAGTLTTYQAGRVVVSAASEGRSGSTELVVTLPAPAQIQLELAELTLESGDGTYVNATVRAADGRPLPDEITWTSEDPSKLHVVAKNHIVAQRGGTVGLIARSGNATARMVVRIPLTRAYAATKVNGKALPAAVDLKILVDSMIGTDVRVVKQRRTVIEAATLVLSTTDSTYRQQIRMTVYEDAITYIQGNVVHGPTKVIGTTTFDDRGWYDWHLFLGTPILQSDRFMVAPVVTQTNAAGDYRRGLLALQQIYGVANWVDFEFTR